MARILLGNIKGPQGAQGPTGPQGPQGVQGPTGPGVPTGGSTGNVLIKQSGTDYDADWGEYPLATASKAGLESTAHFIMLSSPESLVFTPGKALTQNAAFHNSIFRGKNLGTSVTAAQFAAISSGTFDDLFVGDYWVINGVKWRIWDFDRYYGCGDTALNKHHIIVVPDTVLYSAQWNATNTTEGGYVESAIRANIKSSTNGEAEGAQLKVIAAFGDSHVLSYRAIYPTTYSDGAATGWAWTDARVELLNENEVYGAQVWSKTGYEVGISKQQLSLCMLAPQFVNIRNNWWLRNVDSNTNACNVNTYGSVASRTASASLSVRPLSLIG